MSRLLRPRSARAALVLIASLAAGVAAGPPPSSAPPATAPSAFSAQQRAEIVDIVRNALKRDPSILRDAVTALQADNANQHAADTRAAIAAQRVALSDPADPAIGNPQADVTIVEFFDTRCPYCRHLDPTMTQFMQHDPSVRLVFKDLPILGPASLLGSKALLAAQRQGGYAKLRAALMQAPPDTTIDMIHQLAEAAGLDWPRLQRDMDDPAIQQRLDANVRLAHELGIEGTPALVIGNELIPGAVEVADLQKAVADARTAKN